MNKRLIGLSIFFLFFYFSIYGQEWISEQTYYDLVLQDDVDDFNIMEAPEKWKGESAVILNQKSQILFHRDIKSNEKPYKIIGLTHRRILLQDKLAVNEFSEFYFQDSESFVIEIIKKDGTKKTIDTSKGVKVETQIPEFYGCLLYTSPSPRDATLPRMPSSA